MRIFWRGAEALGQAEARKFSLATQNVLDDNKFNGKKSKYILFAKQKTACELTKYGSNACSNLYL